MFRHLSNIGRFFDLNWLCQCKAMKPVRVEVSSSRQLSNSKSQEGDNLHCFLYFPSPTAREKFVRICFSLCTTS